MPSEFDDALQVSASAMAAQSVRLRTIAENLANANTGALTPGGDPYRRKVVTFRNELDRATGEELVKVGQITRDSTPFETHYSPGSPGADANGYVRMPNVNPLIETMDLREAQRSYEANLNVVTATRRMLQQTLNILRS